MIYLIFFKIQSLEDVRVWILNVIRLWEEMLWITRDTQVFEDTEEEDTEAMT